MDITKLLLLGGAGYLGYKFFLQPSAPVPSAVGAAPPLSGIVPAAGANAATTRNLVQAAAAKDGFTIGNVWQWDWYYNKVRGVEAGLAEKIDEAQRAKNLTFDEWWSVAAANGLSGVVPTTGAMFPLRRRAGVGYIPADGRLMIMEME